MRLQPALLPAWLAVLTTTTTTTTNAAVVFDHEGTQNQAVLHDGSSSDSFSSPSPFANEDAHANGNGKPGGPHNKPKNIVFILTDDQDAAMDSMAYMPLVKKYISDEGTTYANHFTTTAVCCPSRVSLWTGKQPHNTNVTDVNPPYGGYPKFISQGLNDHYLPVWLQQAGYNTYYTGKLFNAHTTSNYDSPFPAGWTATDFLLDPGTYSYLNPIYQRNADPPVQHHNEHTSELITAKAQGLLAEALADKGKPFFLGVAPVAPHSDVSAERHVPGGLPIMTEPVPLERHAGLFENVTIPRTIPSSLPYSPLDSSAAADFKSNFNPDHPSGASWLLSLPQHNASSIAYLDHYYRQRLRSLQAVDELVEKLVQQLDAAGVLEDTYVVYTSDNGFHLGQHRLPPGKECGYEEDIRIPFVVRGPGVARGRVEREVVSTHIDVAPTVLRIAGVDVESRREDLDGVAIWGIGDGGHGHDHGHDHGHGQEEDTFEGESEEGVNGQGRRQRSNPKRHEHVTVEYWGFALAEGEGGGFDGKGAIVVTNNTYKAVRIIGDSYNLYYSVWCNNEHELYDLRTDPGQMTNLYPSSSSPSSPTTQPSSLNLFSATDSISTHKLLHRLDALMMVLKSCRGKTCVDPWSVLHPRGDVRTLRDALRPRFDAFYEAQTRVAFDRCEAGYIIDAEGPQADGEGGLRAWRYDEERGGEGEYDYRKGTQWHMWV